jgi:hypothetical protein
VDGRDARRSTVEVIASLRVLEWAVSGYICCGCGQWNETTVDESAGSRQRYVEDCQVCCKPNVLRVSWDSGAGEFVIDAELE